jgi:Beta-ketoacyl synthase, N-terminal domain
MSDPSAAARTGLEVAVIGMAGRFPGAPDLEQFWRNLREGVEGISFFGREELLAEGIPAEQLDLHGYVPASAVLEGAELFDADFFDYTPREAEVMDPQQRLLLETAWQALERAGHAGTRRSVGVFAGTSINTYFLRNVLTRPDVLASLGSFAAMLASDRDFIATRISYKLGLTGPSLTVQTACSTSLVAVHLACQSLLATEARVPAPARGDPLARRPLPGVRRPGRGDGRRTGCRAGRPPAAGGRPGRGRHDPRRDPRDCDQQRRLAEGRLHGAQRRGAGPGHRHGAAAGPGGARLDRLCRGPRYGHAGGRSHRGGRSDPRLPARH